MSAVARNVHDYNVNALPADTAQLVLDELLLTARLDEATLALFSRQTLYAMDCGDYPGVADSWLKSLARSPLHRLSLASCAEVTSPAPCKRNSHPMLTSTAAMHSCTCHVRRLHSTVLQAIQAVIARCNHDDMNMMVLQITDVGLTHIAHHWRLVDLNLSHCMQLTDDGLQLLKGGLLGA